MANRGKLIILSGPSGAGKSTIVREVLRRTGAKFSVSATTRPPRPGEQPGREYRFVDRATFERMIERGELLEWAEVFGELYGTPADLIRRALDEGRTVLLDIDVQGARQVHEKMPEAVFVLICAPDEQALAQRLGKRGTEDPEALARRLSKAEEETAEAVRSGMYTYRIVNDDLERAVDHVVEIVKKESEIE